MSLLRPIQGADGITRLFDERGNMIYGQQTISSQDTTETLPPPVDYGDRSAPSGCALFVTAIGLFAFIGGWVLGVLVVSVHHG